MYFQNYFANTFMKLDSFTSASVMYQVRTLAAAGVCICRYITVANAVNSTCSFKQLLVFRRSVLSLHIQFYRFPPSTNSLCSPVIYAWLDQTYREACKHLFRKMMCRTRKK